MNLTRFHSSNSFLKVNFFKNTQEKAHTLFPSSLIMNISISFKAFQFSLITRIIIAGTSNQKHFFFFRYITDDCFFDNICIWPCDFTKKICEIKVVWPSQHCSSAETENKKFFYMTRRRPMNLQLSADDAPQIRPVQADNAGVNYGSGFIVFLIFFLKIFKRVFFRFTGIVN